MNWKNNSEAETIIKQIKSYGTEIDTDGTDSNAEDEQGDSVRNPSPTQ